MKDKRRFAFTTEDVVDQEVSDRCSVIKTCSKNLSTCSENAFKPIILIRC